MSPLPAGTDPASLPRSYRATLPEHLAPLTPSFSSPSSRSHTRMAPALGLAAPSPVHQPVHAAPPRLASRTASSQGREDPTPCLDRGTRRPRHRPPADPRSGHALRSSQEVFYLGTSARHAATARSLCPRHPTLSWRSSPTTAGASAPTGAWPGRPSSPPRPRHRDVRRSRPSAGHRARAVLRAEAAGSRASQVAVLPGVSTIDTVLADLRLDPVVDGVQMPKPPTCCSAPPAPARRAGHHLAVRRRSRPRSTAAPLTPRTVPPLRRPPAPVLSRQS